MSQKNNEKAKIIIALIFLVLVTAGAGAGYLREQEAADSLFDWETGSGYVLYIGLNDKDTYQQSISDREARQLVNAICARYADSYTIVEAQGTWVNEKGVPTKENTLICFFEDMEEADVKKIMDQVIQELNQDSILMEENTGRHTCYGGEEKEKGTDDKNGE